MTKALMLITNITIHNRRIISLLYVEMKVFISLLASSFGFQSVHLLRNYGYLGGRIIGGYQISYTTLHYNQDIVMITSNPFHLGQDSI